MALNEKAIDLDREPKTITTTAGVIEFVDHGYRRWVTLQPDNVQSKFSCRVAPEAIALRRQCLALIGRSAIVTYTEVRTYEGTDAALISIDPWPGDLPLRKRIEASIAVLTKKAVEPTKSEADAATATLSGQVAELLTGLLEEPEGAGRDE